MIDSIEQVRSESKGSFVLKKAIGRTGLFVALGGGLTAFALPFVADALHVPPETAHAKAAHDDMIKAVLANSGASLVDVSAQDSVFAFTFTDNDTFAVPTTEPDPVRARRYVVMAADELDGTMVNSKAASTLQALSQQPSITTNEIAQDTKIIQTHIANGDVYTPTGYAWELGLIGVAVAGATIACKITPLDA